MEKNKVDITVCNQKYTIISDEPAENILALSAELNTTLEELMSAGRINVNQALILACLDSASRAKELGKTVEKYKAEISDYLEDAEKAMTERDKYKRELEKLKERLSKGQ